MFCHQLFKLIISRLMRKINFEIEEEYPFSKDASLQQLTTATTSVRTRIMEALNRNDLQAAQELKNNYIHSLSQFTGVALEVKAIAELAIEYFLFEVSPGGQAEAEKERQLFRKAQKMPNINLIWVKIKEDFILASSAIQLHIKLIVNNRIKAPINDLQALEKMTRQLVKMHPNSHQYAKSILSILSHLIIYKLNAYATPEEKLANFCGALSRDETEAVKLLTIETRIALLYNCLKTILGGRSITKRSEEVLTQMYEVFRVKTVSKYEQHLLHLFFIIKGLINRKGLMLEGVEEQADDQNQNVVVDKGVTEKLSIWTSVSLDETALGLEEATRSIIRHRVASLATIIGMKLNLPRFCLSFLELMNDSPFNNEAQTIKLCFELFEARQYERLSACLQVVLSSPSCKNLRQREVLLSMCSIFTGLYEGDREGALKYAKLNHFENKKLVLCEETLLQHVGFAYLNLANHQLYASNRQVFQGQALAALKASAAVNPKNYLTQYSLGKLLLKKGDLEGAYNHAKQSLMSGRGEWMPFALLACVYFCQRRFSKSVALIEELLKKYSGVKTLHYIRAYMEVNHMLLDVEHDQEVEAAKELGENLYDLARQRVLKNKNPANLLRYLQQYHQLSLGINPSGFEQNYFSRLPALNHHSEGGMLETFAVGYQQLEGEQTILQIIPLLLQAGQIYLSEILIKNLPVSPSKLYQLALLSEAKGEKHKAIQCYKTVLNQQPYHTQALVNLSMLVDDLGEALHYINIAEKFISDGKLWLAKGILLSRLGRVSEAHQLFIKEGEVGWLEMLPDLLYHY